MISCPSCQSDVDVTKGVCPHCGWAFHAAAASNGPSIVRSAARPKIQVEVQLAATVDRTGSSAAFQEGIPKTYQLIANQIAAKARSVRCWVASHGDLDHGQKVILHTDGGTHTQAIQDIGQIDYGGGGDPPEHHLDAVEWLLHRIPWCQDPCRSRGAIVAFTTADTKPAKSGVTATKLGEAIRDAGLLLYLVSEPTATLEELVAAAQGLLFQISNSPQAAELQKIAGQLAASIVATVASGGTVPLAYCDDQLSNQQAH